MKCPKCDVELKPVIYEGVNIDTCESCEGEWLDKDEISQIIKAKEVVFTPEEISKVEGVKRPVETLVSDEEKQRMCPKCNVAMKKLNYSYSTGIIIDRCETCAGIWLDKDELENIQIVMEETDKKMPELAGKMNAVLDKIQEQSEQKQESQMREVCGESPVMRAFYKFIVLNH
jgi:Zn-finger nucleic acid-binding protein